MSPQWLLLWMFGGFSGFLARWWWDRRSRAPLRLCLSTESWLQLTESYSCSTRRARTAATNWIRFRRAVNRAYVHAQIIDA